MREKIKYFDVAKTKNGRKQLIFYDESSLPKGVCIKELSGKSRIPYIEGKGQPPKIIHYPIF